MQQKTKRYLCQKLKPDPYSLKRMSIHDHYRLQRIALLPTNELLAVDKVRVTLQCLSETEQKLLLALIVKQGLQFFWLEFLRDMSDLSFILEWRKSLKEQCFKDTARYLAQKRTVIEMDRLFAAKEIPYALFKGAHIREVIYPNPASRPSVDIDLLVSPEMRLKAVQSLCADGYTLIANRSNVSHEVSLTKNNVHLDIHWHIMRPGRSRVSLTEIFLQSRKRYDFFWALDNETTLLVMLTHPVFTEYSTGPQSAIIKLLDLKKWISRNELDWERLLRMLEDAGLKTAAWITSTILSDLTGCRLPLFLQEAIKPAKTKRFLLKHWLRMNLSSKFANHPILPKYIFTLLAHDNMSDIRDFIRVFQAEKQKQDENWNKLQHASLKE